MSPAPAELCPRGSSSSYCGLQVSEDSDLTDAGCGPAALGCSSRSALRRRQWLALGTRLNMSFVPAPQRGWYRGCTTPEGCRAGGGLPPRCLPEWTASRAGQGIGTEGHPWR